ncbi:MAG: dihydropyrimidinase [Rhodobacteraceae bacterium]|nr:dihydropyrimidinase [Paracoccaceae bacterium]
MHEFDLVIRGGRVVTDTVTTADIGVRDGKIVEIGDIAPQTNSIDATDRYVTPGGVDPHCHIEQISGMGLMNADDFRSATRSALMGGTTTTISFAAQQKGERLSDRVADYTARATQGAMTDYAFHLSVSDITAPDFDADLAQLIDAGHRSIKVFTTYNIKLDDRAILEVMAIAKRHGALLCVHAENDALIGWTKDRLLAAGHTNPIHHAISHPRMAEIEAVERLIRFAEFLDQPVMLFHISTVEAIEAIRRAKARGVPVRAETCPHYLLMTADILNQPDLEGAKWMCSPPQRTAQDQSALWAALFDGTIDLISSDHAPYRFDEGGKLSAGPNARFDQIANGLPGLEVRLPLMFDAVVTQQRGTIEDFVRLTSQRPAEIYGLTSKGRIAAGQDADLVIWDHEKSITFGTNDLHDNVGYNPWAGTTIQGWPKTVIRRGEPVVGDTRLAADPGPGRWLNRTEIGVPPSGSPAEEVAFLEQNT